MDRAKGKMKEKEVERRMNIAKAATSAVNQQSTQWTDARRSKTNIEKLFEYMSLHKKG